MRKNLLKLWTDANRHMCCVYLNMIFFKKCTKK